MAKNQDEDVLVDETEDAGAEPRVYELGFHLDPYAVGVAEVDVHPPALHSSSILSLMV